MMNWAAGVIPCPFLLRTVGRVDAIRRDHIGHQFIKVDKDLRESSSIYVYFCGMIGIKTVNLQHKQS